MTVWDFTTMEIYRILFIGTELSDGAKAAFAAAGAKWEGSECDAEGWRHRVLVEAKTAQDGIVTVCRVLAAYGLYGDYNASPVNDSHGEARRGPFYRSWHEIDWHAVPRRARLTDLQRAVLGCLLNDAEPTWIITTDLQVSTDRVDVEAVLEELQEQNLVYGVLEEGGEPCKESEKDRWWALTEEGWDLLGLIKPSKYG